MGHELLEGDLLSDVGVVEGRVEHDDGEGEDVASVRLVEKVRVLVAVVQRERLHDSIDLHCFAGQSKNQIYVIIMKSKTSNHFF